MPLRWSDAVYHPPGAAVAPARPGSRSGTLAIPSANSSSMLSKLPCPFIGAQSPLSTTSRALIEASSLFSDVSL